MDETQKREIYRNTLAELASVLAGQEDAIAAMATCAAVLHHNIPYASWTGFYRVVAPRLLRIGPYQGSIGCLEIPFERGVCGAAASTERAQVVADVQAFPGHIACDDRSRSEIVLPVHGPDGKLVAVLDLDSHQPAAFDAIDREELERAVAVLSPCLGTAPG